MASTELHAVMETVLLIYSHTVHTVKKEYAAHLIQIQWRMFTLKRRKIIERFTGNRHVLKVSILKVFAKHPVIDCYASLCRLGDMLPL